MDDVTRILDAIEQGDPAAAEALLPLAYDELRRLASLRLARERPGQALQATALVHEAYLLLVGDNPAHRRWNGRGHFFAAAAEAMRRIVVDRARARRRQTRGGALRVDLDLDAIPERAPDDDLLALDDALEQLGRDDPLGASLVKLRFFAGLGQGEAAEALGLPRRSADRHWAFAHAWLYDRLRREG